MLEVRQRHQMDSEDSVLASPTGVGGREEGATIAECEATVSYTVPQAFDGGWRNHFD